jgi:hypothetical protein
MLEIEEQRRKEMPENDLEKEDRAKRNGLLERAEEIMNEQKDAVKHMNSLMQRAKAATIRDRQLLEKQMIRNEKIDMEKRKDLMLEIERLKKIKEINDKDDLRKEKQREDHMQIIDQIKENEWKRLQDKEEQQREGQAMLRHIKQIQKEDAENGLVIPILSPGFHGFHEGFETRAEKKAT